jgi:hypothetical protein
MTEIDFDGLAVKLAGIAGAAVSMRYLQGSPKAKLTMAAGGALMAYYASPYLSQRVGLPEGLTGFLLGMFGMAVVSRAWVSIEQAPVAALWQAVIDRIRGRTGGT